LSLFSSAITACGPATDTIWPKRCGAADVTAACAPLASSVDTGWEAAGAEEFADASAPEIFGPDKFCTG
jgi:hypothetical protein